MQNEDNGDLDSHDQKKVKYIYTFNPKKSSPSEECLDTSVWTVLLSICWEHMRLQDCSSADQDLYPISGGSGRFLLDPSLTIICANRRGVLQLFYDPACFNQ